MPRCCPSLPLLLALAATPALTAADRYEAVEPAMGTLFRVTLYAESPAQARAAFDAAFARARELDAALSDYQPQSELNRLCRAGRAEVSAHLFAVLEVALEVARKTGGAFDPTVGPLTRLWRESRRTGVLPAPDVLRAARARSGWKHVRLDSRRRIVTLRKPGMQLDLGGIAKGYAADQMVAVLRRAGIASALVAASGDLAIGDPPPGRAGWTVSLDGGETRTLAHCGVSTSGPAEQSVEIGRVRYSHVVDPRTGLGLPKHFPVTVIAPSGILADSLATAFSVLGPHRAQAKARHWPHVSLEGAPVK